MNAYEQKQAARKARLERAAALAGTRARAAFDRADAIGERFYGGQPILVGHHSERRARADQERMHAAASRGVESAARTTDLARRAASVGTGGISSDDPDAIAKLERELGDLRAKQALMAAVNAALRKTAKAGREAQIAALADAGWHLRPVEVIERGGFARFQLANNGANIRRIEKRIAELRAKAAAPERAPIDGDEFTITEDRDANRVQIRFAARQPAAVVAALKSRGFRWAPSLGVWQRQAGDAAWRAAQDVVAAMPRAESANGQPATRATANDRAAAIARSVGLVPVWPGDGTIAITARVEDPEATPAEVLAHVTCHDDGTCDVDADLARTPGRAYFAAMREAGLC